MVRSNDFNEPYLPERYRQKILDKRRKRLQKKILIAGIVIAITVVALVLITGFPSTPAMPGSSIPTPNNSSAPQSATPGVTLTPVTPSPIVSSTRTTTGAQRNSAPALTQSEAQKTAIRFMTEKNNGGVAPPLNLTSVQYLEGTNSTAPAIGAYTFFFERLYRDHPVDTEGILITINAETGAIMKYDRQWLIPDFAFSQSDDPIVLKRDAIFAVMEAAKSRFPASVESIRIISSELRWNVPKTPGTSYRPGSVPLEWKITFDDDSIRANTSLRQASAWVNTRTGNVTSLDYQH